MSGSRDFDLFAAARARVSIADYLERNSVRLKRAGQDQRGPCLLCDSGTTKFRVFAGGEKFRCYGCEAHGDVVDLVAAHRRCTGIEAAKWLAGDDIPVSAPRERRSPPPSGHSASDKVALETWATARPFAGSLAERYLLGRGIAPEVVAAASANLRYHGSAKHHWDPQAGAWVRAPAMVAQVVVWGPEGPRPTGGVHVTYLDRETGSKAKLEPSRRMWGPQTLDGQPGGAWLIGPDGFDDRPLDNDLIVAEGIETALAAVTLKWMDSWCVLRACAALSLNRLQGGVMRDDEGCIDPVRPAPDPEAPAFAWCAPPDHPWGEVIIVVDHDMAEVKARVRTGRGKPCDMRLTPQVRARMSGKLAVKAWLAAGASSAVAKQPPAGLDFNDELRRIRGLGDGVGSGAA